jgi:hypothetical protein
MASRTMVYLDPEQMKALKGRARAERVSVAELIRRSVSQSLQQGRVETPAPTPDVYARLVGVGSSGQADVADEHDARLASALTRDHLR